MASSLITAVRWKGTSLDVTSVRPRKTGPAELAGHRIIPLETEGALPETGTPELSALLKKACHGVQGRICLAIPTDQALLRVMDLPAAEESELQGMVELQVDRVSPFPLETMAVNFEVLHRNTNSFRVLIAAVRRDIIEQNASTFDKAGLLPHWMDVELPGWLYLLREAGQIAPEGRQVILLVTGKTCEMIVIHNGLPVMLRFLGLHGGLGSPEEIDEIADEMSYTLTALETEWGAVEASRLSIWSSEPPPPALMQALKTQTGLDAETHLLEELSPLSEGLARRAAEDRESAHLNLVPPEWHQKEAARRVQKKLLLATGVFFLVWGLAMAAFHAGMTMQQKKLSGLEARAGRIKKEAAEVREVQREVRGLELYGSRSHSALECLREVILLMPENMELTVFNYKKAGTVFLTGQIPGGADPIYAFKAALDKSELFEEIELGLTPTKTLRDGSKFSEFKITVNLPGGDS
ncbi:MAG TPA: pilus assembly protein PilM [Kiritimatiellia bacterium]|nr:pilus assembly protein PilM [Kiritimatiellia bacterium]HNS80587.1 pilus assembly protein PilM [Kiritimatiellia bacterium]HPA78203.1 pilus assembly protein PilM [Kiritimatiellia bacterium]HQQ04453.1 pilus assembly protein PilM [Kiritimatiellia bacterium]